MICPKCQAEVPENAPGGVCPKCLMGAALESQEELSAGSTPTSAQSGGFVPPLPESLSAHFPQLEVLELLGHGGMGAVYKARQKELDRLVAVKILPPEISSTPGFAQRFAREAKALAKLSHPNIVIVHDSGERDGLYYLIMEFVDGANLRTLMQSGDLTPQQAMAIVPQVCEALQYAHDHGVVHRDIKPENILLSQSGAVKIADFGLAKLASHAPEEFTLTRTHQIMGTLKYMAPEQIEGSHEVDHRADIYSLGVVFYELLTGELPLGRFDPPSHKVQIDVRLDEVVLRALEKSPQRRYQQASEVKTELDTIHREPHKEKIPTAQTVLAERAAPAVSAEVQELRPPAVFMILAAIVQILLALVIAPIAAWVNYNDGGSFSNILRINLPVYAGIGIWLMAALAASALMIAGGTSMLRGNFSGWPVRGAAAEMLPFTPVWLFSFFGGVWSILALRKISDQARADAGNPITDRERALRSIRPPGIALMVLGILNAVFGLILMIGMLPETIAAFQRPWSKPPLLGYQILQLTVPLLFAVDILVLIGIAVVGFRITQLKSRRLGIAAALLMIILPSAFYVFSIPVGIWALCVLMQSQVKSAFHKPSAQEQKMDMKPSSREQIRQALRLPAIGLILAGLMNLVVFTLGTVGLAQLTLDIFGVTSGTLEEPGYERSPYDKMREEGPPPPWDIEPMDKHGKDGGEALLFNSNITLAQYIPVAGRVQVTLVQAPSESARPLVAPWVFIAAALGLVLTILIATASGLTMKAGFDLLNLKQTTWGDVASLSVLFIPPGCIIGIPSLIWSWVVRSRPEVRDALAAASEEDWG